MSIDAGKLDRRVTIERSLETENAYGRDLSWTALGTVWAEVRFGPGSERRAAAQVGSTQSATFGVRGSSVTKTVTTKDRLVFAGVPWDIAGIAPTVDRADIVFTATRGQS